MFNLVQKVQQMILAISVFLLPEVKIRLLMKRSSEVRKLIIQV
uniref:Uncharacterized protein n=1 Tax=Candidozyma auris TaxID=498019 RepID=A0A0L0P208_CANAR